MTTVYVAHPIDQRTGDEPNRLILEVNDELARQGFSSYWPRMPWKFDGGVDLDIVNRVNWAAQQACDAVVAVLPREMPTLGVPVEIERALGRGQPVVIISDIETRTVQTHDWAERGAILAHCAVREGLMALDRLLETGSTGGRRVLCVEDNIRLPVHDGDAGLDLVVSRACVIQPGGLVDVPCGAGVALPEGMWGMIVGRSSTWGRGLSVDTRIIDAGYRGPLYANVHNISHDDTVTVRQGERIVQLVPFHSNTHNMVLEQVDTLPPSERGERGHGSSGK